MDAIAKILEGMTAPGEPDSDAIDRRRTVPELAGPVDRPVAEIVAAIEAGKLKHLCKGDVTVSLREWATYKEKVTA